MKSTGKRRAFVVARVDAVPETYFNLTQLLGTLNLTTLDKDFGVVCDLKVIDILVGLQSTSSRHCCPYCKGAKYDIKGDFTNNGLWNMDAQRRLKILGKNCNQIFSGAPYRVQKDQGHLVTSVFWPQGHRTRYKIIRGTLDPDHPSKFGQWL